MKFTITYGFDDKTYSLLPDILITFRNGFGICIIILNLIITIEIKRIK